MKKLLLLWLLLASWAAAEPVVLYQSPGLGWRAAWELEGARWALQHIGAEPTLVSDLQSAPVGVLVLPEVRNLDAAAVRAYADRGGKLLVTGRTELGDLLGVKYLRQATGTEANRLGSNPNGVMPPNGRPEQTPAGTELALPRHTAALVEALPGTEVLARWDLPLGSPAIVATNTTVYCGENLFAPELAGSLEVQGLLASMLGRLDPGFSAVFTPGPPPSPKLSVPEIPPGSQTVAISLGTLPVSSVRVHYPQGNDRVVTDSERVDGSPYVELWQVYPNGTARWAAYRGSVVFKKAATGLEAVNEVPLDAYLAGVVPSEMPGTFPLEALKAQAVVARSYTLSHLKRHKTFDLCAEVHCQVYRGLPQEGTSTTQAVVETAGQVLAFDGKPIDGSFSAVCGGAGEAMEAAWPKASPLPYQTTTSDLPAELPDLTQEDTLRAFLDGPVEAFCGAATRFRWEVSYPWAELEAKLRQSLPVTVGKGYVDVGPLQKIEVTRRDASGRVAELTVTGAQLSCCVGGDAVRWLTSGGKVGAGGLQSSLFYLDLQDGTVRIKGGGWGHGVGLCQEGAAGRAKAGQSFREILSHYYPGAALTGP